MEKIDKNFDGVSWEWDGKEVIRNLKPICPGCEYELDIIETDPDMKINGSEISYTGPSVSYSCPNCSSRINTTKDNIDSPKDLRKAVLKEFEHRQRLKASENTKD